MIRRIINSIFIFPVKIYQWIISPILPQSCRFTPSCSQYTIEAIREWGPIKGIWLGTKRISKCHPWGGFGEDPVPQNPKRHTCDDHTH